MVTLKHYVVIFVLVINNGIILQYGKSNLSYNKAVGTGTLSKIYLRTITLPITYTNVFSVMSTAAFHDAPYTGNTNGAAITLNQIGLGCGRDVTAGVAPVNWICIGY